LPRRRFLREKKQLPVKKTTPQNIVEFHSERELPRGFHHQWRKRINKTKPWTKKAGRAEQGQRRKDANKSFFTGKRRRRKRVFKKEYAELRGGKCFETLEVSDRRRTKLTGYRSLATSTKVEPGTVRASISGGSFKR